MHTVLIIESDVAYIVLANSVVKSNPYIGRDHRGRIGEICNPKIASDLFKQYGCAEVPADIKPLKFNTRGESMHVYMWKANSIDMNRFFALYGDEKYCVYPFLNEYTGRIYNIWDVAIAQLNK